MTPSLLKVINDSSVKMDNVTYSSGATPAVPFELPFADCLFRGRIRRLGHAHKNHLASFGQHEEVDIVDIPLE